MPPALIPRLLATVLPVSLAGAAAIAFAAPRYGWQVTLGVAGGFLLVLLGVLIWTGLWISRPLKTIAKRLHDLETGHPSGPAAETDGPVEIQKVAHAANTLGKAIPEQIEKVRLTTELKERNEREHAIASGLQQAILPKTYPIFPDLSPVLDVYGHLRPGREAGGDFFDAFELPSGRIALLVAGLSEKGVAASLFMTQTRILIRVLSEQGVAPNEVLRRANRVLAKSSAHHATASVLLLDYDPVSGLARMASAGHPPPFRILSDGNGDALALPAAPPLAAAPSTAFSLVEQKLEPGDTLVLQANGTTNPGVSLFDPQKLKMLFSGAPAMSCQELANALLGTIGAPAGPAPQIEDVTLVVMRRLGGKLADRTEVVDPTRTVRAILPPRAELQGLVAHLVEETGRMAGLGREATEDLVLATDEVLAKVIEHARRSGVEDSVMLDFLTVATGLKVVVTETGEASNLGKYVLSDSASTEGGAPGLLLAKFSVSSLTHDADGPEGHQTVLFQKKRKKSPAAGLLP